MQLVYIYVGQHIVHAHDIVCPRCGFVVLPYAIGQKFIEGSKFGGFVGWLPNYETRNKEPKRTFSILEDPSAKIDGDSSKIGSLVNIRLYGMVLHELHMNVLQLSIQEIAT